MGENCCRRQSWRREACEITATMLIFLVRCLPSFVLRSLRLGGTVCTPTWVRLFVALTSLFFQAAAERSSPLRSIEYPEANEKLTWEKERPRPKGQRIMSGL